MKKVCPMPNNEHCLGSECAAWARAAESYNDQGVQVDDDFGRCGMAPGLTKRDNFLDPVEQAKQDVAEEQQQAMQREAARKVAGYLKDSK